MYILGTKEEREVYNSVKELYITLDEQFGYGIELKPSPRTVIEGPYTYDEAIEAMKRLTGG